MTKNEFVENVQPANSALFIYVSEIVDTFEYLRIVFSENRKSNASEQAYKAIFSWYVKIRNLTLPLDCQPKLFDNTVVPILLYSSEIWGYGDLNCIEKIHTDFLKHNILNVKNSTPHCMLYSDLRRFPLSIHIKRKNNRTLVKAYKQRL